MVCACVHGVPILFYSLQGQGSENFFGQCLRAPVTEILAAGELDMATDPVELYKRWVNQTEVETGEKSALPYEVDREQALSHPEIAEAVSRGTSKVLTWAARFLDAIMKSVDALPYGLRHLCMDLEQALQAKFPGDSKSKIDRVLCNLL